MKLDENKNMWTASTERFKRTVFSPRPSPRPGVDSILDVYLFVSLGWVIIDVIIPGICYNPRYPLL